MPNLILSNHQILSQGRKDGFMNFRPTPTSSFFVVRIAPAIERSFGSVRLRFVTSNSAQDENFDLRERRPFMNFGPTPTQSNFDFSFARNWL
jgi:hypothetical protein